MLLSAGAEERALRRGRRGAAGERVRIGTRGPSRECLGVKMGCKGKAARGFLEVLGMPGAAGGGRSGRCQRPLRSQGGGQVVPKGLGVLTVLTVPGVPGVPPEVPGPLQVRDPAPGAVQPRWC